MSFPDVRLHDLSRLDAGGRAALMRRTEASIDRYFAAVDAIIAAVREEGDLALSRFAKEFDKAPVEADQIRATEADFERAFATLDPAVRESIAYAAHGIREFHQRQKPEPLMMHEVRPGVFAGEKCTPIPSVACYVPRGKGAFPSVMLMTTIPAVVAGVPRVVVVTPPGPDGQVDDASLVAARLAGVSEVYKCGGAQAVAAVAYGTATVPRCDKVIGPGSPWVVAAKRRLAGIIDPGIPAGPSEAIVLAEPGTDPAIAALDVIVESEHGPDSSAFLVTTDPALAEAVRREIKAVWAEMGAQRAGFSSTVLSGPTGGVVLAPDWAAAVAFVNDYAPEHLVILAEEPMAHLGLIENAGEVLLGRHTPIPLGNFVLGPNAVLPTAGQARTHSALGTHDFMKRISVGHVTAKAYAELARHAHRLALYEGFDGHAIAVGPRRAAALAR